MKMSEQVPRRKNALVVLASAILAVACVSTTTGMPESNSSEADAASINFQLAIKYYQNGNYELARDRLLLSTEQDPKQATVWSALATTYEQLGNLRLAEETHAKALRVGPRNFDVQNSYAVFLCGQQRFADAKIQFDKSIGAATNDNPEVMMTNAGVCMMQAPDYDSAEDYFRQALDRRPAHSEALLQMTLLKHQTGDNLTARAFLQRYQSQYQADSGVLYLCVLIEEALGDQRARSECANELLRGFPESIEAQRVLGD